MAANSLFSSNDSNPNNSFLCFKIHPYSIILPTIFFLIVLTVLPVYIFILHHGLQQWRKKVSSSSSSSAAMSHSDCFTYNMVLMELVQIIGEVIFLCGYFLHNDDVESWGHNELRFSWMGKMSFHLLTCVERYLAVVHPITYMRLKNSKGIRIRNVSTVCVWVFSAAYVTCPQYLDYYVPAFTFSAVSFFSLSVLLVLVRPGPGEQGGNRQWADPSKKRAFFTIVSILGVLVLIFFGDLVWLFVQNSNVRFLCVFVLFFAWVELPNSLVLPLLFLLRHGRSNKQ